MEPSWLPQYHQTNLGINNNNNNNSSRIIKEHDYIIGLANSSSTSTSYSSSKFTHNTMNHDLCNLNNTHQKNGDDGGGAAAAAGHDDGEEEDHTDLCLGLGLPGSRNPAKNGTNSNNSIIIKPITTTTSTTTTTTTINLNHPHNNGVKRGYNEAILLLDRYSTTLPSTATNRPNDKLPCEPPPPLNNDNDPDNTNANANITGGVIGVGIGVGVGVAIGHGANDPPPAKDRVIGWPPIRSYRKNTLVKPSEIFVKVNMDGVAVGRKVDLNAHNSYEGLLFALEDMFLPSNSGGSSLGDSKHLRLLNGSDYVLTYEDKDGDWMLVGDVPWSMFTSTVKRLRIQRGAESMGIGKPLHK